VTNVKVLEENKDDNGVYKIRISAVVKNAISTKDALAFQSLLKQKLDPAVAVVGSVGRQAL